MDNENNSIKPNIKIKKRDKAAKIQAIIATTRRLIEQNGYLATSTNRIAKEAGVNIALLYRYFPEGKFGILRMGFRNEAIEFLDDSEINNLTPKDIPTYLENFLIKAIQSHRIYANTLKAMEIAYLSNNNAFQNNSDIYGDEVASIGAILKHLQSLGKDQNAINIEELNPILAQIVDSIVHRHVIFIPLYPTDEELAHNLAEIILRAIGI